MKTLFATAVLALAFCHDAEAVSLEDLRNKPRLTPQSFASHFSDFRYLRQGAVQSPEVFLFTKAGDCDDFATLAAEVLKARGFTTRLISVRMARDVHVICYVEETRSFLDFNNRGYLLKTVSCANTLPEIARKVSKSFETDWTSVCEFVYSEGIKTNVRTITKHGVVSVAAR